MTQSNRPKNKKMHSKEKITLNKNTNKGNIQQNVSKTFMKCK